MIVKGGTLITPNGLLRADLVTAGERIQAVLQNGGPEDPETPVVDATGLWVLPGGVDAHTHFGMPLDSELHSLGWRESSTAALLGGTTTVVDFANPERGEPLAAAVTRWREMAEGDILCDYGLHCTVIDTSPDRLAEIPVLAADGVPSFKGFLAYPGRLMLEPAAMKELMEAVKTAGGLLLVHAEDGLMNAAAQDVLLNAGRIGPRYHPLAHPEEAETRAVARVLAMARETSCPLEIVHMSLARSVQLLLEARAADPGATLLGEVCLHHLLAESGLYESGFEPALAAICSPPLRPAGNGAVLREALARGDLDLLSTDHCEFPLNIKSTRAAGGFHQVPNGCGGVGERLVFSFTELVEPGLMTPERWIESVAARPARIMGLQGRKGLLEPGHDADIVLFDPQAEYTWEPAAGSDRAGSLWAGQKVKGAVRDVWLRGRQVVTRGRLMGEQPGGVFLSRDLPGYGTESRL